MDNIKATTDETIRTALTSAVKRLEDYQRIIYKCKNAAAEATRNAIEIENAQHNGRISK